MVIPFSLYTWMTASVEKVVFEHVGRTNWQQAGETYGVPPLLSGESQLCLIPKVENIPCPDQFQPISVTNSKPRVSDCDPESYCWPKFLADDITCKWSNF